MRRDDVQRRLAQQQVARRVGVLDDRDDGVRRAVGVAGLPAGALSHRLHAFGCRLCVRRDPALGLLQRTACPVGAERARLDATHADAERTDLRGERVGPAFDRVLARCVVARARVADDAGNRRDVDHVAAAAGAHARQHGTGQREQAEAVDLELVADRRIVAFLDRALVAVAGVVHQHIDRAETCQRGAHRGVDLRRLRDVQVLQQHPVAVRFQPGSALGDAAAGGDHAPTVCEHAPRQRQAEPGGAARNEPDEGRRGRRCGRRRRGVRGGHAAAFDGCAYGRWRHAAPLVQRD